MFSIQASHPAPHSGSYFGYFPVSTVVIDYRQPQISNLYLEVSALRSRIGLLNPRVKRKTSISAPRVVRSIGKTRHIGLHGRTEPHRSISGIPLISSRRHFLAKCTRVPENLVSSLMSRHSEILSNLCDVIGGGGEEVT